MEKLIASLLIVLLLAPSAVLARGSSFSSSRSSFSSSRSYLAPKSYSAPKAAAPKAAAPKAAAPASRSTSSAPKYAKPTAAQAKYTGPGFAAPKTVSGSYRPSFSGGYSPPIGSNVYYHSYSFSDLLFWSYFLNHNGQQQVIVQQPNGQKVTTTSGSTDWIYWLDWLIVILLAGGLIFLVVWFVNKRTRKVKYAV